MEKFSLWIHPSAVDCALPRTTLVCCSQIDASFSAISFSLHRVKRDKMAIVKNNSGSLTSSPSGGTKAEASKAFIRPSDLGARPSWTTWSSRKLLPRKMVQKPDLLIWSEKKTTRQSQVSKLPIHQIYG